MKTRYLSFFLLTISLISFSSFSQTENNEPLLGLPGDDLDLYAVLDLFQKSKTIEEFEKSLNDEKSGIVNLDLNNDGNADFIKVVTEQDGDDFLFILQDPISEKETQDVAVISVSKDAEGKVTMQIIGDKDLYGKDYVVEPNTEPRAAITANPAYAGTDPVTVNVEATTEVVVVESTTVVTYVYSPYYVPYYPTYYYGYYPHWWRPVAVVSIGIYRHNHWHHHGHYHGGHGSVHIHNHNSVSHYNNNKRNTSNTVNNNINNGNFNTAGKGGSNPSTSQSGRTSSGASAANKSTSPNSSNKSSSPNSSNKSTSPYSSNKPATSGAAGSSRSSSGGRTSGSVGARRH